MVGGGCMPLRRNRGWAQYICSRRAGPSNCHLHRRAARQVPTPISAKLALPGRRTSLVCAANVELLAFFQPRLSKCVSARVKSLVWKPSEKRVQTLSSSCLACSFFPWLVQRRLRLSELRSSHPKARCPSASFRDSRNSRSAGTSNPTLAPLT